MCNDLVTIGIPTYNRPEGLKNVIKNFIQQSYSNIEIIISDNCSTNKDVVEVCQYFAKEDARIKVFRQTENIGMYENFNFLVTKARGKYFMWASDDDEFDLDYIKETIKIFKKEPNVVLSSALPTVVNNGTVKMKYKPDFDTIGLNKIERIRKIAFYIKKGHSAIVGLIKTDILKKIKIKTYLDCDGLFLIELSQYGEFHKLNKYLMKANLDYPEDGNKISLTKQKTKLIKMYSMKPSYFLINHEKVTLWIYFSFMSLKFDKLNLVENLKVIAIIYRSFWGYNTIRLLSIIRTFVFFLKKKKVVLNIHVNHNQLNLLQKEVFNYVNFDQIIISMSENGATESQVFNNLKSNFHMTFFFKDYTCEYSKIQYSLDHIKENFSQFSHCILIKDINRINELDLYKLKSKLLNKKNFNKCYVSKDSAAFGFPIRKYISFKNENTMAIKTSQLENDN